MRYVNGFSAARHLTNAGRALILTTLMPLPGDEYITGGAIGGDALLGRTLWALYPAALHTVIVPANRQQVDPWWTTVASSVNVLYMPPGSTYEDRNQRIVDMSNRIYGYPRFPENDPRSRRSGTWQTIRMARRAGKPYGVHILERETHGPS